MCNQSGASAAWYCIIQQNAKSMRWLQAPLAQFQFYKCNFYHRNLFTSKHRSQLYEITPQSLVAKPLIFIGPMRLQYKHP